MSSPSIFGTLLERALIPTSATSSARTTRRAPTSSGWSMPTIDAPLRGDWDAGQPPRSASTSRASAERRRSASRNSTSRLCELRVLDPACGTGNFLYVTLEHFKRLEGEVLPLSSSSATSRPRSRWADYRVRRDQFLGIEVNRARRRSPSWCSGLAICNGTSAPGGAMTVPEPVIRLRQHPVPRRRAGVRARGAGARREGQARHALGRRDAEKSPVTGEDVPDEAARVPVLSYVNPRRAEWPEADFIVGNPPYIGKAHALDLERRLR